MDQDKEKGAYDREVKEASERFVNLLTFEGELGELDTIIIRNINRIFNGAKNLPEHEVQDIFTAIRNYILAHVPLVYQERVEFPNITEAGFQKFYDAILSARSEALERAQQKIPIATLREALQHHPGLDFPIDELLEVKINLRAFLDYKLEEQEIKMDGVIFSITCSPNRYPDFVRDRNNSFFFTSDKRLRGNYLYELFDVTNRPNISRLIAARRSYKQLLGSLEHGEPCQIQYAFQLTWLFEALRYKLYEMIEERIAEYIKEYTKRSGMTPQQAWTINKEAEPSLGKAIGEVFQALDGFIESQKRLDEFKSYILDGLIKSLENFQGIDRLTDKEQCARELGKIIVYLDCVDRFILNIYIENEDERARAREELRQARSNLSRDLGTDMHDNLHSRVSSIGTILSQPVQDLFKDAVETAKKYAVAGEYDKTWQQITNIEIYATFMAAMADDPKEKERIASKTAEHICEIKKLLGSKDS